MFCRRLPGYSFAANGVPGRCGPPSSTSQGPMDVLPPPDPPPPELGASPSPHEQSPDGAGTRHEAGRLSTLIAVSIALVSVLGAVAGWRAEVHSSRADRYEQDAVAASISAAQVRSHAEQLAAQAASQQEHFARL